jgi:glycosyltransferase involved in cell wall biosynthesis
MLPQRIKVLILLPNVVGAGGQRAVINLFRAIDRQKFEPTLLVQEKFGSFLSEVAHLDGVEFMLDREFDRSDLPYLVAETTRHALHADIVLAGLEGRASFCGLIAAKIARKPVVAWIHIDWRAFIEMVSWRQKISLRSYALADHVVACSKGAADNFSDIFSIPRNRISMIYNGIPLERVRSNASAALPDDVRAIFEKPTVVMVGRLDEQKGYPYVIDAHARLMREGIDHNLVIIGEGGQLPMLQAQAEQLGVENTTHFLGFRANPHLFIKHATVFASSSVFEGFGLVLAEALACGKPIVATNCPSGPAEVLANGEYGVLVQPKDPGALAEGMRRLLVDAVERDKFSKLGPGRAEMFDESVRMQEWEDLLRKFARPKTRAPMAALSFGPVM